MQLRPDVPLRASIRALTEVVLPAVDPNNQPAIEQLQLTIGLLSMIEQRLPLTFKFDCDELRRLLAFVTDLKAITGAGGLGESDLLADLSATLDKGNDVLRRAQADPAEVLDAVRELRAIGGAVAADAYRKGSPPSRAEIMKTVLAMSGEQLLRDRAWVSPQRWETDPAAVPPIADLLATP